MKVYAVYWPEYEGIDIYDMFTTPELCIAYIKRIVDGNPEFNALRWKEYEVYDTLPFSGISLDG